MNIKFFALLWFIFSYSSFNIHAQENKKNSDESFDHFLEIGLGLNFHAVRDHGTSPLIYKGYLPAFHLQYFFSNKKFIGLVEENFHIGYLKTRNFSSNDNNSAISYNNELSFDALYNFKNYNNTSLFVGGELGTLTDIRVNDKFNNANLNYEFLLNLAPSAMLEYRTSWKAGKINLGIISLNKRDRNFKLQYVLSVPVVTTLLRPGYVTISDFVDNNSLAIQMENVRIVSFDHLFLIKNRFNLYYILHNNNMLKFNYNFSYFSYYRNFNPVKGLHSTFFVSIIFRFSNNN